jgi:hypothetical protein
VDPAAVGLLVTDSDKPAYAGFFFVRAVARRPRAPVRIDGPSMRLA